MVVELSRIAFILASIWMGLMLAIFGFRATGGGDLPIISIMLGLWFGGVVWVPAAVWYWVVKRLAAAGLLRRLPA